MERRISFFNNSHLEVNEFEKIQLAKISLILDNVRIDKKLIFENYLKDFQGGDSSLRKKKSKYSLFSISLNYNDFLSY